MEEKNNGRCVSFVFVEETQCTGRTACVFTNRHTFLDTLFPFFNFSLFVLNALLTAPFFFLAHGSQTHKESIFNSARERMLLLRCSLHMFAQELKKVEEEEKEKVFLWVTQNGLFLVVLQ